MEVFPAVLIGGPPHSGKSVLAYGLTQALRQRGVQHYVLRAYPDGEGDWSNEAPPELVRLIRVKGRGTPDWVDHISHDIARRHLPLIVDVGGLPTPDQERIFDVCTHAIVLSKTAVDRVEWLDRVARHRLVLIADLHSQLIGTDLIGAREPYLTGTIAYLERQTTKTGVLFDALSDRLTALFQMDEQAVRRAHLGQAPTELVVDLDRLSRALGVPVEGARVTWKPEHLPHVLDYLPAAAPLALYGRGPNWLYAALAHSAFPADFYQFDPRLDWVKAQRLSFGVALPTSPVQFHITEQADGYRLDVVLPQAYVDYSDLNDLLAPQLPPNHGVVINGKLPHWLWTSLTITYAHVPWLAIVQPQLNRPVLVHPVGHLDRNGL